MADVKCSLVSLIMSGGPATAAEMTVSIRWTGSSAPSSGGYKTMGAPQNGDCVAYMRAQRGS